MKNHSLILSLLSFSLLIALWAGITYFGNFSEQVFPAPSLILVSGLELIKDGTLLKHIVASLYRVTMGFYLAVALGIPLGIILGRKLLVKQLVNPIIQFLRPISPLAWIPLAMLWFGIGDKPAIFLIFLSSFFPLVVATTMAVSHINPVYFHVAANFNFSRKDVIVKIIIPAILPEVLTALRLTIAIAWLVVVAAEMIAVQSGLGYLILDARNALRMDVIMVGMIVIGMIGVLLDLIMLRLAGMNAISWNGNV